MLNQLHRIKIQESFADAVYSGDKTFEVRKNDRGYQKGDYVDFVVLYDSDGCEYDSHPLTKKRYEITYFFQAGALRMDTACLESNK